MTFPFDVPSTDDHFLPLVVIVHRGVVDSDEYGNDVLGEVSRETVPGAVAPQGSEVINGSQTVIDTPTAYLTSAPSMPVRAVDQIVSGGVTYEATENGTVWVSPFTGLTVGVVVKLKHVEG